MFDHPGTTTARVEVMGQHYHSRPLNYVGPFSFTGTTKEAAATNAARHVDRMFAGGKCTKRCPHYEA